MIKSIVFLGTPELAVPSLQALVRSGFAVPLVITRPDQPAGRGRHFVPPPVKEEARRLGLNVWQPESINTAEGIERLRALQPDLGVTVAYGELLRDEILTIPRCGFINMHPSLLPRHRGSAPIQWTLLWGDRWTGVTIILVNRRMDSGPVLSVVRVPISADDNAGTLHDRLSRLGAMLLADTAARFSRGEIQLQVQNEDEVTLAPKLKKDYGWMDWSAEPDRLRDFVRGMTPWPSAFSELAYGPEARRLHVTFVGVEPVACPVAGAAPGTICHVTPHELVAAAGSGAVSVKLLKPAGRRLMEISEFLCGHDVRPGDRFLAPGGLSLDRLMKKTRPRRPRVL